MSCTLISRSREGTRHVRVGVEQGTREWGPDRAVLPSHCFGKPRAGLQGANLLRRVERLLSRSGTSVLIDTCESRSLSLKDTLQFASSAESKCAIPYFGIRDWQRALPRQLNKIPFRPSLADHDEDLLFTGIAEGNFGQY